MTASADQPDPVGRARRSPLPLTSVTIDDSFWTPRQELIRTQTLPQQHQMLQRTGQFEALRLTWRPGDPNEPHIFWESDVAKWIEAASYCLAVRPDPDLDSQVDEAIDLLAGAQQPDGYLNVYFTVVRPGQRFTDLRDAHELYCAGHLIEAAVAHHQATGKTSLLDLVERYADLIDDTLAPGGACAGGYDGHEEIELALVKLYRATGERRYLELSKRMIDARGTRPYYFDIEAERRGRPGYFGTTSARPGDPTGRPREYDQSHQPITEQTEIVGHSVRAMYLLSAVTDLAGEYGDADLLAAAVRLWDDLVSTKLYVTGGLGSDPSIEGFSSAYDLPNRHGYAETCAAIGLVQWAQRMADLTGQGRYVDILERALYNGVLSGASADATSYFYDNPLASAGDVSRHEWFGVACCPPNLARLVSGLGHYVYAQGDNEATIHLFAAGAAQFDLADQTVTLQQHTDYPRTGWVTITVTPEHAAAEFTLRVRMPGWADPTATLNGQEVQIDGSDGYLRIERRWSAGDTVDLDLKLRARRTWAHPAISSTAGCVAIERGPLVYCLEGVDHDARVTNITLPRSAELSEKFDEQTGQVIITASAIAEGSDSDRLYRPTPPSATPAELVAVPYYSWGNRGQSDMTVWVRETPTT